MKESYLPSRKVTVFGVALFAALAVILGLKYYPTDAQENAPALSVTENQSANQSTGTAAIPADNNTDTVSLQSTGTTTFDTLGTTSANIPELPDGRENKTQKRLARLAPKIAKLSASGNYTQQELNVALQQLVTPEIKAETQEFDREDINIEENTEETYTSPEDARQYAVSIAKMVQSKKDSGIGKELQIVASAMMNENSQKLKELDPVMQAYDTIITKMQQMPVPAEFAPAHIKLLNGFAQKRQALANMRYYVSDPLRGQAAINVYRRADKKTTLARQAITELSTVRTQ
jgi:hypothetical protein